MTHHIVTASPAVSPEVWRVIETPDWVLVRVDQEPGMTDPVMNDRTPTFLLRKARWRDGIHCPRCGSCRVKKNGSYRVFQRYYCKFCAGTFNDKTGTIFHYTPTSRSATGS